MRLEPGLIARIVAQPKSPEARLACAQWLEEHGAGPRAQFIRAQVALRTWLNPAQRWELETRARKLLKAHGKDWAAELPGLKPSDLNYSQGFIEELGLTEKQLAEHGERLLSSEPVHRLRVGIQDGKAFAEVAAQPWFAQIRKLKLLGKSDAGARALASSEHVTMLEHLLLSHVSAKGVSALARSEALPGLRTLGVTGSEGFDDEGVQALAEGHLALERIFLSRTSITSESVSRFAGVERFQSLKVLALNGDELEDEDAETLAASKVLVNLERLELGENNLSQEGVLVFRSTQALPRLKHLDLRGMCYDARELEPLRRRFGKGLKF
jgi:uncharacterized protein (TIGR02996 family)